MIGFSIILPTLHRTTFLLTTLTDLVVQKFEHPFEIIIVDQSNQEDQKIIDYIKDFKFVKYHHITHFKGLPQARNYGASAARFDYLLYLDDDIRCKPDLVSEHYKFLIKEDIAMVAGGITEKHKTNTDCETGKFVYRTANPLRGFHIKGQKKVDHAGGGNFSIKKNIFNTIGGVDEQLTKGAALYEETDLCLRLKKEGYSIFFNYDAHMFHLAAETGGCRVLDIKNYIFSLSRNRTMIINRYLSTPYKITANLYLFKLMISYMVAYKDFSIFKNYSTGVKQGKKVAKKIPLRTV